MPGTRQPAVPVLTIEPGLLKVPIAPIPAIALMVTIRLIKTDRVSPHLNIFLSSRSYKAAD